MRKCLCLLSVALGLTASASHIRETLTLAKGWNAIYLESTPDGGGCDADCAVFFAGLPVTRVGCYVSDAYTATKQYSDDGKELVQKPLSYQVWMAADPDFSTLNSLRGGCCYLIYATNACTKTFYGIPAAPRLTWRKADTGGDGFLNLAGVSTALDTSDPSVKLVAAKYFGEGPYGSDNGNGAFYTVGGTASSAPRFTPSSLFGAPKVQNGRAYALTAVRGEDWPGVVEVQSTALKGGLDFADGASQASITVRNRGNTNHVFRLSVVASAVDKEGFFPSGALLRKLALSPGETAWTNVTEGVEGSWTIELASGEAQSLAFAVDRAKLSGDCGAVLQFEDLGESHMRVRVPVTVGTAEPSTYPQGLWVGAVELSHVSFGDDAAKALPAAGKMKATIIMHVGSGGKALLMSHVALAENSNGVVEVFRELDSARAVNAAARRLTSVMLGTETDPVAGEGGFEAESGLEFRYTIGEDAVDNPFRHAFHPDHDGLSADYTAKAPSGDNIANYASGAIKPELWSVTNTVRLVWKDDTGKSTVGFSPESISYGIVNWKVEGLKAAPILMRGMFAVKRVNDAEEVE